VTAVETMFTIERSWLEPPFLGRRILKVHPASRPTSELPLSSILKMDSPLAVPPDVRKGWAFDVPGVCPADWGVAPRRDRGTVQKVRDFPHIGRHSRLFNWRVRLEIRYCNYAIAVLSLPPESYFGQSQVGDPQAPNEGRSSFHPLREVFTHGSDGWTQGVVGVAGKFVSTPHPNPSPRFGSGF
jgi:hypothetical protein